MTKKCNSATVLFLAMILISIIQFPSVRKSNLFRKKGLNIACATRIPNAVGLITEAQAATQNKFLYSLIQPVQLTVLFVVSLLKKEPLNKQKLAGSLICIISIAWMTWYTIS